ncbi:hypothetical protein BCV72DRAFT_338246 [Rhizopus microsporus var. microsporus]|uniref:Homeodomain-like DNA binding domain-containing transcription factor n=1 Tax=Rhizopus microsporus var. microsporus TaxID=86635 RepID=A0A1X0QTH8_RHIZD|nr:hypothetical protein BCV72DRAFT_338246 [Rhizopus microsporus var. microsporus]
MNTQFFYEDGQGRVVDEHEVEPMDLTVDEELFTIETISSRTQFLQNKPPERPPKPMLYPVGDERDRVDVYMDKSLSASAAATQLSIHIRAAQRWVKRYYEDPESIFEKKKKSGRRRILGEEHKQFLLNYIDENPSAVLTEVVPRTELVAMSFECPDKGYTEYRYGSHCPIQCLRWYKFLLGHSTDSR